MSKFLRLGITVLVFLAITPLLHAQMRITEYMYDGTDLEFIEFTNTGNFAVDMTGWSYDDDSRAPGTVSLSAFGLVQPGESVVLAESSDTAFRRVWGLCPLVKVIGKLATNLGRKDEINLFDASNALADRLTYGDQDFPGTIRTTKQSGWVNAAGLGANTIAAWTLSTAGDAEGSIVSLGADVGSPGRSTRTTVSFTACPPGAMRITEYMYDGTNMEFIEFTNTGTSPVDMSGYSFDDDSRAPGTVSLSGFGVVQPGESVILSESSAAAFRTAWGLCNGIKIVGNLTTNLGRKDEINLFDASNTLVDRLSYGDQDFPGTIRTTKQSGWVSAAGLGTNNISAWTLSVAADAEASFTSTGGDVGSPGKTIHAMVPFTACGVAAGAPVIAMDVAATTDDLDEGVAVSPISPYAISGVSNDASDPARIAGINFTIGDDATPVGNLIVSVTSSNLSVVPNANLLLTGTGATRNLKITPGAAGYSNITLTVSDGSFNSSFVIAYAASQSVSTSGRWATGIADASAAIALDDDYMVIANDESNLLYVYKRNASGLPVKTYDFTAG
ncbi:MAG TPA: lamin tail domain-containing protein, partial [Chryseolinea sp.]|nr:lamin tail domain-containing protein [Chryseolinea sp.]